MWAEFCKYSEMSKTLHEKHVKFIIPHMQMCISNNCSAMKIQLNRLLIPSYGDGAHSVRIVLEEYWGCNRFGVLIYKKLPIAPNIWLVLIKAFMAGLSEVLWSGIWSCRDYLCPFIEHGWWVFCRYHHFHTQANVTAPGAASVGCHVLDQFPLDVILQVLRLQVPHILRQFSGFSTLFCTERMHVRVVARFEIALCEAEVVSCWLGSCSDSRLVHNALHSARQFPSSGHCCLFLQLQVRVLGSESVLEPWCCGCLWWLPCLACSCNSL